MSDTLALTEELIRCQSITPDDGGCQELISERLKKLDFYTENMPFVNVKNLWARRGTKAPLIVFAGHTDVVPPGRLEAWETPPFSPSIRNGYLYGRGAADMKSGLAAMIIAAEQFIQQNPLFNGSIGFLITSDEEGASIHGTKRVMEELIKRKEKIDYCIVGEASSNQFVGDQVRVGRRGSLSGELIIFGKQGHVAFPEKAINPVHVAAPFLRELTNTVWDEGNEFFPPTTFQISNIHAGTGALNVIPGELQLSFNFRFGTVHTAEELQQKFTDLLEKYQLSFDLKWDLSAVPFLTQQGKLITAVKESIHEISQQNPVLSTGGGTSDGRFIAPLGTEVVELGPVNASVHQVDEHVSIADLDTLTSFHVRILEKVLL